VRKLAPFVFVAIAGCSSVLGLRDIEEGAEPVAGPPGDDDENDASISKPKHDGALDGSPTSNPDASEAGSTLIPCLGKTRNAFFCDDFEPSTLSSSWSVIAVPDNAFNTVAEGSSSGALPGSNRRGQVHIGSASPLQATATWTSPLPGPLAFQVTMKNPTDAWADGDTMKVAALTTSEGKRVEVVFTRQGANSNGNLSVIFQSATPIELGSISSDTWLCIELVADGTDLTAYRGPDSKGKLTSVGAITSVELGVPTTTFTGKDVYYDDVVLAPAQIGCLH
jgi:hypothetical protein